MKVYEVMEPYPHVAIRDGVRIDVEPGGTFDESEVPPDCQIDLNVAAGRVKVVQDKVAAKAQGGAATGGKP